MPKKAQLPDIHKYICFLGQEFIGVVGIPRSSQRKRSKTTKECKSFTSSQKASNWENALFPGLTNFRTMPPCRRGNRDHDLLRRLLDGWQPLHLKQATAAAADPRVANCKQAWPSASSPHPLHPLQAPFSARLEIFGTTTDQTIVGLPRPRSIPGQCGLKDRHFNDSV